MSAQVLLASSAFHLSENSKPEIVRRSANFQPSIWGDRFIAYTFDNKAFKACSKEIEELKEEIRSLIVATNDPLPKMNLIDAIQRLGVGYHFEREIEEALEKIYDESFYSKDDENLYAASLRFRLLRQQGYKVSCDVFEKFKDEYGNFKGILISDVFGMLCLYEATHLRIHGEDILDEAVAFTTIHLKSIATHLRSPLSKQVAHALKQPFHKGMPRLEARHYISIYEEVESHNEMLLKLAKLDFNLLQSLYLNELSHISKWWKDLDFASKLPFARNRIVECYFWIIGVYFEPQYALSRKLLTKVIAMTSIIDDTYDVYGTLEEIQLFTDAVERWDINAVDQLPQYMKIIFYALLEVYHEMEETTKDEQSYSVYYAKEAMKKLLKAYFAEAKWFYEEYIPTVEEYMNIALITSGTHMLTVNSFVGMENIATKKAFDWAINEPKLVRASEIIGRLKDDMVSHEFEQERGHVASAVECYMKQHGVSRQEVLNEFNTRVEGAWKDINEECLKPNDIPMSLLVRPVNLSRMIDVIYKNGDGYTNPEIALQDFISSLFIDHVPL